MFAIDKKKKQPPWDIVDIDKKSNLLGNMAALVGCRKKHISAGPLHREATARGHLS